MEAAVNAAVARAGVSKPAGGKVAGAKVGAKAGGKVGSTAAAAVKAAALVSAPTKKQAAAGAEAKAANPWMVAATGAEGAAAARRSRRLTPGVEEQQEVWKSQPESKSTPVESEEQQSEADTAGEEPVPAAAPPGAAAAPGQKAAGRKRKKGGGSGQLGQEELVARAFVSGTQEADFAAEKERAIDSAAEAATGPIDVAKSGWGNWGGTGVKGQARREREARKAAATAKAVARKKAEQQMGGSKLARVLLNERKAKGSEKFEAKSIPFEFQGSRSVYESSLRTAVGPEWNTARAFKQKTKPLISVRTGQVIQPIKKRKGSGAVQNAQRRPLR